MVIADSGGGGSGGGGFRAAFTVRAHIPTLETPTLTISHLVKVWRNLEAEGKTPWLFYDGQTETLSDFIDFMTHPQIYAYTVYDPDDDSENGMPLAHYWVNNFMGNAAMMHFAYLDAGLSRRYEIGIETCNFLLRCGGLSALIGITPKPFRHAWRFALEVGFVKIATIPEACRIVTQDGTRTADAIVTLCTRETLKPMKE